MHASFSRKGKVSGVPTVVHRTNRGGISGSSSSFSGFRPDSKDVCSEPLRDVAGARRVRINNAHDRSARPKSREQIVRDAWAAVEESKGDYCLFTNNCEHFSKGARNGTETSQQVRGRGGEGNSQHGVYTAGSLLTAADAVFCATTNRHSCYFHL